MAYASFCSDGFTSAVHVYDADVGVTVRVAADVHGHPAAGEERTFPTRAQAADFLRELRRSGLHVPEGTVRALRAAD